MKPPKQQPAVLAELSQYTRAVLYGRGSVILIHGTQATYLNDAEAGKLAVAHDAFMARRQTASVEKSEAPQAPPDDPHSS